jgi:nitroreductase
MQRKVNTATPDSIVGSGKMDLIESFEKRRSVRGYTDEPVPDEVVNEILRVANLAPSAGNLQARDFVVIKNEGTKRGLAAAAHNQMYIAEAPVVIVCCANLDRIIEYGPRGRDLFCLQDVAASIENMLLYIAARGYGACWVGTFDERRVAESLGLPDHARPVAILPVGRPKKEANKSPRVGIEELVHSEKW